VGSCGLAIMDPRRWIRGIVLLRRDDMETTWLTLATDMGWIAVGIILVLLAMSVTAFAIAWGKWQRLRAMAAATRELTPELSRLLEQGEVEEAIASCRNHPESHVGMILGAALEDVAPMVRDPSKAARAVETAERTIDREQILLASELRDGLGTIATIGATAPFLGLLGTVIGITNSFTGMATAGGGGIEAIARGIGEALITTAVGLVVAIPAVWLYNHFMTRLEQLFSELAYASRELVDWLLERAADHAADTPPMGDPAGTVTKRGPEWEG